MITAGTLNLQIIRGCTFEPMELQMLDGTSTPVNLTGYNVAAEVRLASGSPVILDLSPTITDAVNGIITIPGIDDETTGAMDALNAQWDLLVEDGSDNRQQTLRGRFDIINKITDST